MQNPDQILDAIHERSIDLIMDSFLVLADVYRLAIRIWPQIKEANGIK